MNPEELAIKLYDLSKDMDGPDYEETAGRDIKILTKELITTREQCKTLYSLLERLGGET